MAYDHELADRIRRLIANAPGLTEKKMFGGHAFLIAGNMAIAASSQGGAMVRVDPQQSDALVATTTEPPDLAGQGRTGPRLPGPQTRRSAARMTGRRFPRSTTHSALSPTRNSPSPCPRTCARPSPTAGL
jgi:hypothetical protein